MNTEQRTFDLKRDRLASVVFGTVDRDMTPMIIRTLAVCYGGDIKKLKRRFIKRTYDSYNLESVSIGDAIEVMTTATCDSGRPLEWPFYWLVSAITDRELVVIQHRSLSKLMKAANIATTLPSIPATRPVEKEIATVAASSLGSAQQLAAIILAMDDEADDYDEAA